MGFFEKIANLINGSSDTFNKDSFDKKKTDEFSNEKEEKEKLEDNPSDDIHSVDETTSGEPSGKESIIEEPLVQKTSQEDSAKEKTEFKENGKENRDPRKNCVPGTNIIEKKNNLINAIVNCLEKNYRGEKRNMSGKSLLIYISDPLFRDSLENEDFINEVISSIDDETGLVFGNISVDKRPSDEDNCVYLFDDVSLSIKNLKKEKIISAARISPVVGYGMTLESEYLINSELLEQMPGHQYNIGLGRNPDLSGVEVRENHIALDDSESSPYFEKNKYVSRTHACITYSDKMGFMLKADQRGTRLAGKRTHIMRGSKMIELQDSSIAVPLQHGDHIVLSKYVHLLFEKL